MTKPTHRQSSRLLSLLMKQCLSLISASKKQWKRTTILTMNKHCLKQVQTCRRYISKTRYIMNDWGVLGFISIYFNTISWKISHYYWCFFYFISTSRWAYDLKKPIPNPLSNFRLKLVSFWPGQGLELVQCTMRFKRQTG